MVRVLKDIWLHIPVEEYGLKTKLSNKGRGGMTTKGAFTLCRTHKYGLKKELKSSMVFAGLFTR